MMGNIVKEAFFKLNLADQKLLAGYLVCQFEF